MRPDEIILNRNFLQLLMDCFDAAETLERGDFLCSDAREIIEQNVLKRLYGYVRNKLEEDK